MYCIHISCSTNPFNLENLYRRKLHKAAQRGYIRRKTILPKSVYDELSKGMPLWLENNARKGEDAGNSALMLVIQNV